MDNENTVIIEKTPTEIIKNSEKELLELTTFNNEKIELIRRTLCVGASNDELEMFMHMCKRSGLDPFAKQIYAIMRWNKKAGREVMQTQVSIDGLRVIAERSGKYEGQTQPFWCGRDRVWHDVWIDKNPPIACKLGVYKKGFREATYAIANWEAYVQNSHIWKTMGPHMLAKCCEALSLRKTFPQDMAGLYTGDEMGQQDNEIAQQKQIERPKNYKKATVSEQKYLYNLLIMDEQNPTKQTIEWIKSAPEKIIQEKIAELNKRMDLKF